MIFLTEITFLHCHYTILNFRPTQYGFKFFKNCAFSKFSKKFDYLFVALRKLRNLYFISSVYLYNHIGF